MNDLNINTKFVNSYIVQLSLRDILIYDTNELIEQIKAAYNMVLEYKEKTISSVVKDFLNKPIYEQRNIIIYFLLLEDDSEIQYFAYLLYDLISNESYLLKSQPLADQIFNSLHWSVQKIFKSTIDKSENYTNSINNISDNMLSYEKRICLLKTTDNIKSKALDKLKEISDDSFSSGHESIIGKESDKYTETVQSNPSLMSDYSSPINKKTASQSSV